MWDNPQRFVFADEVGQHIARNTLYMNYKRALKQAGLPETLRFHDLRHNFATLLFEAGVEPLIAMKILGHTDYQTTANIYTHLDSEMMKKSSVDM